jgi:hypothetical protein
MKINPEHFPFIIIAALVVFAILGIALGFTPAH